MIVAAGTVDVIIGKQLYEFIDVWYFSLFLVQIRIVFQTVLHEYGNLQP